MGTLMHPHVSGFTRRSWRYQSCLGAPYHHLLGSATSEQTSCGVLPREVKKSSMYRKFTCRTSFTLCEITPFLGASFSMSCKITRSHCATDHRLARIAAWLPSAGTRPCFRGRFLKPFPASLPMTGPASCSAQSTHVRGMHAGRLLSRR